MSKSSKSPKQTYRYCSTLTGELVSTFWEALKISLSDAKHYKVLHWWDYRKEGF